MTFDLAIRRGIHKYALAISFTLGLALLHCGLEMYTVLPRAPSLVYYEGDNLQSLLAMFMSGLGVMLIAGTPIATGVCWLARHGVDRFSLALYIIATLVSLHYLHN
jgi:hypothetical protein